MEEILKKPKIIALGVAVASGALLVAANVLKDDEQTIPPHQQTVPKGVNIYNKPGDPKPCGTTNKPFYWPAMEATKANDRIYDRYSQQMGAHTSPIKGRECNEYWVLRPGQAKSLGQLSQLALRASY